MTVMAMEKDKTRQFLAAVARNHLLIAPVRDQEGVVLFRPVQSSGDIDLNFANSKVSPKEFFFPRTEKLFSFSTAGGSVAITGPDPANTRVLFGVRPCDLRSILSLDPVFSGDFPDAYYEEKRNKTIIIALACETPGHRCFCTTFGYGPADGAGADLILIPDGLHYLVESMTGRGEELMQAYVDFMSQFPDNKTEDMPGKIKAGMSGGKVAGILKEIKAGLAQKVRRLDTAGVKEYLDDNFELPYWSEIASRCLNCGICTYICPTCHCFNIIDLTKGGPEGIRCRGWDSCMFGNFTRMAGGHNPRLGKVEKVRNRFMHKLKYHLDRYGLPGCSGCGRCVGACPVNIDIREIISHLREVVPRG